MSILHIYRKHGWKFTGFIMGQDFRNRDFQVNQTKPEFEGRLYCCFVFPRKRLKLSPMPSATRWAPGKTYPELFTGFNTLKILNPSVANSYWIALLEKNHNDVVLANRQRQTGDGWNILPNTNKPLHSATSANNNFGWSVADILKANGLRGFLKAVLLMIAVFTSARAWSLGSFLRMALRRHQRIMKGDHFVGDLLCKVQRRIQKAGFWAHG